MTDITKASGPKDAATKPRISLLSLKQSTRLKSEDSPTDRFNLQMNLQNSTEIVERTGSDLVADSSEATACDGHASDKFNFSDRRGLPSSSSNGHDKLDASTETNLNPTDPKLTGSSDGQRSGSNHANVDTAGVCKEDLIRLLSMMKSELQSKEIAIASMKLEQLKRLMNPVEINRSVLASTYIELQDRLNSNAQNRKSGRSPNNNNSNETSSALHEMQSHSNEDASSGELIDNDNRNETDKDDENLTLLNTLLKLLDRHPLLALPRDSLYCLDYTCNELSTKNYLNLKIQHLENLIDQHRRFRYFMRERLKRSEQRYLDLTLKLEHEKNVRINNEKSIYRNEEKTILLKHIDQIKEDLEGEKARKHAIVMTLLNELLDERERNEELTQRVLDLEAKLAENNKTKAEHVKNQQSSPPASQQAICKPRVPAKPAQLLDRQRSQTKNR